MWINTILYFKSVDRHKSPRRRELLKRHTSMPEVVYEGALDPLEAFLGDTNNLRHYHSAPCLIHYASSEEQLEEDKTKQHEQTFGKISYYYDWVVVDIKIKMVDVEVEHMAGRSHNG